MDFGFRCSMDWKVATPALAAYSSHQNDQDIGNFLTVYPFAKSTKLDDCVLCHPGGTITRMERPHLTGVVITATILTVFSPPWNSSLSIHTVRHTKTQAETRMRSRASNLPIRMGIRSAIWLKSRP